MIKTVDWSSKDKQVQKILKCKHKWYYDGGDHLCEKCCLVSDLPIYIKDPHCTYEFWPKNYDRFNYFNKIWQIMAGKLTPGLLEKDLDDLILKVPVCCDWYEVYQIFKNWDLKEWWMAWNIMSSNPKRIELMKSYHIHMLYYVDNSYKSVLQIRKKKKLNVMFTLYKVVELYGDDLSYVPMKLRSTCIDRLDQEWKEICIKFNWKFIPTKKTLTKFHWEVPLFFPNRIPPPELKEQKKY